MVEMDEKKMATVSYLAHESAQTRSERIIHRLILALIITVGLLFASNVLWLLTWTNHTTAHIENSGTSNYIGEDGTINNEN